MGSRERGGRELRASRVLRDQRDGRTPKTKGADRPLPPRAKWMTVAVALSALVSIGAVLIIASMWAAKADSPWLPREGETAVRDIQGVEQFMAGLDLQTSPDDPAVFV